MSNKVISVSYSHGREGTSLLMGILQLFNIDVGSQIKNEVVKANSFNPKGFFELKSHEIFLRNVYGPNIYPNITHPPDLKLVDNIAKNYADAYKKLLLELFNGCDYFAVKSPRFLSIPLLFYNQDLFEVKNIIIRRKTNDHIKSIKRVWQLIPTEEKKFATEEFLKVWLKSWSEFGARILETYQPTTLVINFEDIINQPKSSINNLSIFLNKSTPDDKMLNEWIDKKLVNREKIN